METEPLIWRSPSQLLCASSVFPCASVIPIWGKMANLLFRGDPGCKLKNLHPVAVYQVGIGSDRAET